MFLIKFLLAIFLVKIDKPIYHSSFAQEISETHEYISTKSSIHVIPSLLYRPHGSQKAFLLVSKICLLSQASPPHLSPWN